MIEKVVEFVKNADWYIVFEDSLGSTADIALTSVASIGNDWLVIYWEDWGTFYPHYAEIRSSIEGLDGLEIGESECIELYNKIDNILSDNAELVYDGPIRIFKIKK